MNRHFLFSLCYGDSIIREEAGDGDGTAGDGDGDGSTDENQDDTGTGEDDDEDGEDDEELPEEELKEARELYKALKDPNQREHALEQIASRAGFKLEARITKAAKSGESAEDAAEDISEILVKALGKDYAWLADKLTPALKTIIGNERKQINQKIDTQEQSRINGEVAQIAAKLNRESNGLYGRLESKIAALADEILPAPGISTEKYMRNLFTIAAGGKNTSNSQKRSLADKIRRNANDVGSRLASQGGTSGTGTGKGPGDNATMDELIDFEAQKLKAGAGKRK